MAKARKLHTVQSDDESVHAKSNGFLRLFMVEYPRDENIRVLKFLSDRQVEIGQRGGKGPPVAYFGNKEEAKMFRDVVNDEYHKAELNRKERHPSDYRKLVRVEYGPDHS